MNSDVEGTSTPFEPGRAPSDVPGARPDPATVRPRQQRQRSVSRAATIAVVSLCIFAGLFTAFAAGMVVERAVSTNNAEASTGGAPEAFDRAWDLVQTQYVDPKAIDDDAMLEAAIDAMLLTLHDEGHTRFMTAEEARAESEGLSGAYVGVGIQVDQRDGQIVVVSPIDHSPAKEAGVLPGDILISVDGRDVTEMEVDSVIDLIRGEEGTKVTLVFKRGEAGDDVAFDLVRRKIEVSAVSWTMLEDNVALIRLSQFSSGAGNDVAAALQEAKDQGATSVIFDLRNNPGGYINEAIQVGSMFVPEGSTVFISQVRDGTQTPHVATSQPVNIGDLPLVVLINEGSASSSEIVSGAVKANNPNATIIGETTFGTGTVLSNFGLGDGSALLLGTELWLTPEGNLIKNQGIRPDVVVGLPANQTPFVPVNGVTVENSDISDNQLKWAIGIIETGQVGADRPSLNSPPGRSD